MREDEPGGAQSPGAPAAAAAAPAALPAPAPMVTTPSSAAAAAAAPAGMKMTSPLRELHESVHEVSFLQSFFFRGFFNSFPPFCHPAVENKYKRLAAPTAAAAAPVRGAAAAALHNAQPISSLNPYNNRWCICVRITAKVGFCFEQEKKKKRKRAKKKKRMEN